jgi:hypothetical protein
MHFSSSPLPSSYNLYILCKNRFVKTATLPLKILPLGADTPPGLGVNPIKFVGNRFLGRSLASMGQKSPFSTKFRTGFPDDLVSNQKSRFG